jgi:hypothetical protein
MGAKPGPAARLCVACRQLKSAVRFKPGNRICQTCQDEREQRADQAPAGTTTITRYVSDIDQSEIAAGEAYQMSIRHPDGSTQQLDISAKNYRDLKLEGLGKKRGPVWPWPRARQRALAALADEQLDAYRAAYERLLLARPAGMPAGRAQRAAVRQAFRELEQQHPRRYRQLYRHELARARTETLPRRRGRPPGVPNRRSSFDSEWLRDPAGRYAGSNPYPGTTAPQTGRHRP